MRDYDQQRVGGLPVLVLVGLATALAWVFANPFVGWMIIFGVGVLALGLFDWARRRRRPPAQLPTAREPGIPAPGKVTGEPARGAAHEP